MARVERGIPSMTDRALSESMRLATQSHEQNRRASGSKPEVRTIVAARLFPNFGFKGTLEIRELPVSIGFGSSLRSLLKIRANFRIATLVADQDFANRRLDRADAGLIGESFLFAGSSAARILGRLSIHEQADAYLASTGKR